MLRQISPSWGFIEQVEDLLFGGAWARDIEDVVIGEFYHLSDTLAPWPLPPFPASTCAAEHQVFSANASITTCFRS